MNIKLLPPDINKSRSDFAVEELPDGTLAIRYALAAIKGVGGAAMNVLVQDREESGPFTDLFDLAGRVGAKALSKKQYEALTNAGAFDSLNPNRAQCFAAIEMLTAHGQSEAQQKESGQNSLFGGDVLVVAKPKLPDIKDWLPLERLQYEFNAIGFYLSAHPLDSFARTLQKIGVVRYADIGMQLARSSSSRFKFAGVVLVKSEKISKSGNRFAFVQLSDSSGVYETVVFSEMLAAHRDLLEPGTAIILSADVQMQEEGYRLTTQQIQPLDKVISTVAESIAIAVEKPEAVNGLKSMLEKLPKGKTKVSLLLRPDFDEEIELELPGAWQMDQKFRATVTTLPGVLEVVEG
jgi:DNA polymerase-3 subunit alpha